MFILKNCRKTSAILDGSYVTQPSSVRIEGKEEFTPKRKVLRVDHHYVGALLLTVIHGMAPKNCNYYLDAIFK